MNRISTPINKKLRYSISCNIPKMYYNIIIRIQKKRKLLYFIPFWKTTYKEYVHTIIPNEPYLYKWSIYHRRILWNLDKNKIDLNDIKQQTYINYQKFAFMNHSKHFLKSHNQDKPTEIIIL